MFPASTFEATKHSLKFRWFEFWLRCSVQYSSYVKLSAFEKGAQEANWKTFRRLKFFYSLSISWFNAKHTKARETFPQIKYWFIGRFLDKVVVLQIHKLKKFPIKCFELHFFLTNNCRNNILSKSIYSIFREPLFDSIKKLMSSYWKKAHLQVTRCLLVVERP